MKDVINFLKSFPLEEMQPATDLNINKRFEILNKLKSNDHEDFLHLYYDKTFLQKLTISPKLGSYSSYQLSKNMNKFFQIYLDLSTSSFIDDPSYYYKLYISKYIDIVITLRF